MKALSLWQPWATLVATGEKIYETRHWAPRGKLRRGDLLAIHAAKVWNKEIGEYCYRDTFRHALMRHGIQFPAAELPRGAMLCIVKFVDIFHVEDILPTLLEKERAFGNYGPRRFAWQLEVVHVFDPPITATGQRDIFEWELPAEDGDTEQGQPVAVEPSEMMPRQLRLF